MKTLFRKTGHIALNILFFITVPLSCSACRTPHLCVSLLYEGEDKFFSLFDNSLTSLSRFGKSPITEEIWILCKMIHIYLQKIRKMTRTIFYKATDRILSFRKVCLPSLGGCMMVFLFFAPLPSTGQSRPSAVCFPP